MNMYETARRVGRHSPHVQARIAAYGCSVWSMGSVRDLHNSPFLQPEEHAFVQTYADEIQAVADNLEALVAAGLSASDRLH